MCRNYDPRRLRIFSLIDGAFRVGPAAGASPSIFDSTDAWAESERTMRNDFARTGLVCVATLLGGLACLSPARVDAQEHKPEAVLVNLVNPCGVAVQQQTGFAYVATRHGVYCYDPSYKKPKEHKAWVVIDGYPDHVGVWDIGTKYDVGPLGLAFLDKDRLIVGGGSRKAGEDLVRVYRVPGKPLGVTEWMKEDTAMATLGPIKSGKDTLKGEGTFYGVAVGAGAIWVTCQGDDSKGWVAKAAIKSAASDELKLGELTPLIQTKTVTETAIPTAITFTPDGKELVVGQMGDTESDNTDSVLAFYDPANGTLKRKLKAGLRDLTGLAYSPKTHTLYATDLAAKSSYNGGLFSLAIDGENVKPTKIAPLDKPTALAFDAAGHLYVSVLGTSEKARGATDPGALIYFKPGL
jgi:DNA-binding beta-propeller fold protein YncE